MTVAQLVFKKGNFINTVELDIIVSEGAVTTARVTENPVEFGANVNDHIIIEPMTFSVAGIVSNISAGTLGQISTIPNAFSQSTSRAKEAWDALLELQVNRRPFLLVQGLKEYNNVIILSLSEAQDKDTANGLFFTATMKEIIFIGSEIVTADQFDDPDISDKMVPATSGGLKQLNEIT